VQAVEPTTFPFASDILAEWLADGLTKFATLQGASPHRELEIANEAEVKCSH
jgi:hypothetical protein